MKINSANECFGNMQQQKKRIFEFYGKYKVERDEGKETCNIVNCMNLEQT